MNNFDDTFDSHTHDEAVRRVAPIFVNILQSVKLSHTFVKVTGMILQLSTIQTDFLATTKWLVKPHICSLLRCMFVSSTFFI